MRKIAAATPRGSRLTDIFMHDLMFTAACHRNSNLRSVRAPILEEKEEYSGSFDGYVVYTLNSSNFISLCQPSRTCL